MKSNAPGQLLGFTIQFPRALYHLLKSGPGECVCVEVLGDVATITQDGGVIAEEDKSSIVGNPLTDKSIDLWKTFSNWVNAINSGHLKIENTRFILYTNKSGKAGIVNEFHSALTIAEVEVAIENAKTTLSDIKKEHEVYPYLDNVFNKNLSLLKVIVQRFELEIGEGAGYDDIFHELKGKHVAETQIKFLCDKIAGWLQRVVLECLASKTPAVVKWEDFDHEFKIVFERSRCRELIDFAIEYYSGHPDIANHIKNRPRYVKQLEVLDCPDEDVLEAVTDYLRAKVNISKWIEDDIIDSDIADDFEKKLIAYWKSKQVHIALTQKTLDEKEKGRLIYCECKMRQEQIRDMTPPSSTIEGTYHALANKLLLGWHPQWSMMFSQQEEV